jgi:hypothetical protein
VTDESGPHGHGQVEEERIQEELRKQRDAIELEDRKRKVRPWIHSY